MHLLADRFGHTDAMKRVVFVMMLLAWGALAQPVPRFHWQDFTKADGLADDRVYNVAVDGTRVWAATENGLGLYENGTWRVFRPEDGLAHRVATYVAVDKKRSRCVDCHHGRPEPLEEANAAGGYGGKAFHLLVHNDSAV